MDIMTTLDRYLTESRADKQVIKNMNDVNNLKSLASHLEGELFYAIKDANFDPENKNVYNLYVDELMKEISKFMKK